MKENILLQPNEEIVPIPEYEGLYSITSFGRVWSHSKQQGFRWGIGFFLKFQVYKKKGYNLEINV